MVAPQTMTTEDLFNSHTPQTDGGLDRYATYALVRRFHDPAPYDKGLEAREPDLRPIGPPLVEDAVLATGTYSAVLSSRKAQLQAWKQEYAAPNRSIYTRLPNSIEVSPVEPVALEHGKWRAVTIAGESVASGSYTAKWRNVRDERVIETKSISLWPESLLRMENRLCAGRSAF